MSAPPTIPFRIKLIASYVCATLVLLVGIAAFVNNELATEATKRATSVRSTLRKVLETENGFLRAEASQRGYLLTGRAQYRAAYEIALGETQALLEDLPVLAADDAQQHARALVLRTDVRAKLAELQATVIDHDRGGTGVTSAADAHALSQKIHATVAAMVQHGRMTRDVEDRRAGTLYGFSQWFVGFGNAVAFVLAVAVTFWIGKAFRQSQEARASLEEHTRRLEDNAQRLAKQEQQLAARLQEERRLSQNLEHTNALLQRSNADLEQFAYVASHDLRAPLRGIATVTEWIEEDLGTALTSEAKRHLDALRGRVRRLDALVTGIASYSRAGQRKESSEIVDVGKLLHEVVDLLAPPDGVEVVVEGSMPVLQTPRVPLQQIFMNLLSNAIRHGSANGGRVEVGAAEEPEHWSFWVRDFGPGIALEYHQRIFGLFQTLAARDRVEGTGIGLATVKKLVDRYGGTIALCSSAGRGATFTFTWPKHASSNIAAAEHA